MTEATNSEPRDNPLWAEQERLEHRMTSLGIDKFRAAASEAYQSGDATKVGGARFVLQNVIEPTAAAIDAFVVAASSGVAGRKHTLVRYVTAVTPEVCAYLAAKLVLDGFAREQPLTTCAVGIGAALELEQRLAAFEKGNKPLVKKVLADLASRTNHQEHKRKVIMHLLRTHETTAWTAWAQAEQLAIGIKLIELLIEATRIATIEKRSISAGRTRYVVQLTPAFKTWLSSLDSQLELLCPEFMPCVIPPRDWSSLTEGGYYTDAFLNPPTFVKTRRKAHVELLAKADLSLTYRAVNAIQRTPWAIETRTLDVMKEIVTKRLDLGVLPAMEDGPIPERPAGLPADHKVELSPELAEKLKVWKREARDAYATNEKLASRRLQVLKAISLADEFSKYPAIYFPHQLDFRGRIYAIPQVLNPQGADFAKGLLVFAEGVPLDNERAQGWFMIHGANTFGKDKTPLDERIQWVHDNDDAILAVAADPLANLWWTEADAPFCFLTWCFEWAEWTQKGDRFISRLPIGLDGTCNGLQHYSAMLRDPVGGAATNLVPGPTPQDIYGEVAKVVMQKLWDTKLDGTRENAFMAQLWWEFGIDRTITKRPVMVLPYGGTIASCQEYVALAVREKIEAGSPDPFGPELRSACIFLANVVWESIGDVVVAARAAMGWLMDTTRIASHDGRPVQWTAPSGFPVYQAYPEVHTLRIMTRIHGEIAQINLSEDVPDTIDKRRQANGVAPNFVHSLDAAALVLTVNLALDNGVKHFAMIHDSYGTSAPDTDMLAACTRHAFVDMYEENDVLNDFRTNLVDRLSNKSAAKVQTAPTAGGLDLSKVIESSFFFA